MNSIDKIIKSSETIDRVLNEMSAIKQVFYIEMAGNLACISTNQDGILLNSELGLLLVYQSEMVYYRPSSLNEIKTLFRDLEQIKKIIGRQITVLFEY